MIRRQTFAPCLAILAALLLALMPRGFMPVAGAQGFELTICSAEGMQAVVWDPGLPSPKPQKQQTCPFALLSGTPLPSSSPGVAPALFLLLPLASAFTFLAQDARQPERLRPPAQGPPTAG